MDISDPVNPVRLDQVVDKNFAYWHSATFNNDGTKVIFTDEWGGGGRPRCRAIDPPTWGGNAIFDIVDRKLQLRGYYKLPAAQTEQENCVAHNGSIIPVPGRDIMVQAWYQGGVSVFDFTDSAHPVEIAYFDRGPIDPTQLVSGGYWSAYWYNGNIYGAEIARGIDVFRLTPSEQLSQNEIDAATLVRMSEFNAQQQPKITWEPTFIVARAYLDQLTRSKGISAGSSQRREVRHRSRRSEQSRPSRGRAARHDCKSARTGCRDEQRPRCRSSARTRRNDQGAGSAAARVSRGQVSGRQDSTSGITNHVYYPFILFLSFFATPARSPWSQSVTAVPVRTPDLPDLPDSPDPPGLRRRESPAPRGRAHQANGACGRVENRPEHAVERSLTNRTERRPVRTAT